MQAAIHAADSWNMCIYIQLVWPGLGSPVSLSHCAFCRSLVAIPSHHLSTREPRQGGRDPHPQSQALLVMGLCLHRCPRWRPDVIDGPAISRPRPDWSPTSSLVRFIGSPHIPPVAHLSGSAPGHRRRSIIRPRENIRRAIAGPNRPGPLTLLRLR